LQGSRAGARTSRRGPASPEQYALAARAIRRARAWSESTRGAAPRLRFDADPRPGPAGGGTQL